MSDNRKDMRLSQASVVMPLIGGLLDAWDGLPNDLRYQIHEDAFDLYMQLELIAKAIENDDRTSDQKLIDLRVWLNGEYNA